VNLQHVMPITEITVLFFLADSTGSINEEMHLASLLNLAFGFRL